MKTRSPTPLWTIESTASTAPAALNNDLARRFPPMRKVTGCPGCVGAAGTAAVGVGVLRVCVVVLRVGAPMPFFGPTTAVILTRC